MNKKKKIDTPLAPQANHIDTEKESERRMTSIPRTSSHLDKIKHGIVC
jgi:hypothetical protein